MIIISVSLYVCAIHGPLSSASCGTLAADVDKIGVIFFSNSGQAYAHRISIGFGQGRLEFVLNVGVMGWIVPPQVPFQNLYVEVL